jgi:WD40 repeat protein
MNVDTVITQLAKMMRDRRAAGGAPYVLLLGSSLSLTSEVRRAVCGSDDWETFWATVEKMSPAERRAAFKGPLERLLLAGGYRALTRLLAAGYFEVVFTLNVDDTLDNALRALKADQRGIWIYGEVDSAELVAALEYRSPRVRVLKLRGDINKRKLPLTPEGQFEFPPNLEHAVRQWLSRDTMVVGDLSFDDDVWRCLRGGDGALWVVELETSERLRRVKQVRQKGEVIAAESFNAFFTALAAALEVEEVKPAWELTPQNPYQGLEAFTQDKALFFFGRERLMEKLLERLRRERFLAVVGASGSGKSSVIQAGLLHRLAQGALPGSADWRTLVCRPGELVDTLAQVLRGMEGITADERRGLLARVPADETAIDVIAERVLQDAPPDHRLVLVVDQFEELFTLESAAYREQVIAALLHAVRGAGGRTTVVVTMRADFYARVAEYDELFVWMEQHRVFVPPMNRAELRDAIQRPARLVKFPLDDALTETILKDAGQEPGTLPLLQYALKELYDRWKEGLTPPQAYREIRGVQGALEHRADEVYRDLNDRQQAVARHILVRLTQLGEGTEDTRRRATFAELTTPTIALAEIEEVIDILAAAQTRLVVTDDPDKERPGQTRVVEVAHEALIRGWKRLQDWLNEDRAGLLLHQRLGERAREWAAAGRHEDYLYRGLELGKAREWAETHTDDMNPLEREFLVASVEAREVRRITARRQVQRVIAGLVTGLVIISALAIFAWGRSQLAEQRRVDAGNAKSTAQAESARAINAEATAVTEAAIARSRGIAAVAATQLEIDAERSLLLAIEAVQQAHTFQAEDILRRSLIESRVRAELPGHARYNAGLAWSPDGSQLAIISTNSTVQLWDTTQLKRITTLQHNQEGIVSVAWSPNGVYLAATSHDGAVWLWDIQTGEVLDNLVDYAESASGLTWRPDSRQLAIAGCAVGRMEEHKCLEEEILIWEVLQDSEPISMDGLECEDSSFDCGVESIAWSPDSKYLATGLRDGTVHLWNPATTERTAVLKTDSSLIFSIAWSPDGEQLASLGLDNKVRIWGVDTESIKETRVVHIDSVSDHTVGLAWSPNGKWLAFIDQERTIRLWNIDTGQDISLTGHTDYVKALAWSADSQQLASASVDGVVRLWDVAFDDSVTVLSKGLGYSVDSMAWNPQGAQLAFTYYGMELWNVNTGRWTTIPGSRSPSAVAWDPSGTGLAFDSQGNAITVRDVVSWKELLVLEGHSDTVLDIAWSPDGTLLASVSGDHTMRIWDTTSGDNVETIQPPGYEAHGNASGSVTWNPDGMFLVFSLQEPTMWIWNLRDGEGISVDMPGRGLVDDLAWSPDGTKIASASGEVHVWDAATGERLFTPDLPQPGYLHGAHCVAWSPDGHRLAFGYYDGTIYLWDVGTQSIAASLTGHTKEIVSLAWSPDGRRLASGSWDFTARIYYTNIQDLMAIARRQISWRILPNGDRKQRQLAPEEKYLYLGESSLP